MAHQAITELAETVRVISHEPRFDTVLHNPVKQGNHTVTSRRKMSTHQTRDGITPASFPRDHSMRFFITSLVGLIFTSMLSSNAVAASKTELDARVRTAMTELYERSPASRELANKAAGVLVFPRAVKVGVGFGGKIGEGALLVNGIPVQYYRVTAGSFGFQFGAQARSEVLMFMTADALENFRNSQGWEAGVDGSVALVEFGVGDSINTNSGRDPIIGFVFGNKGLMYDLSLEGTKYWRIDKYDDSASSEIAASGE